jgi:hypothetical protein
MPRVSKLTHASAILPPAMRWIEIPDPVTCLPVGGIPWKVPWWVPPKVRRVTYTISLEIENAWGQVNSSIPLGRGLLEMGVYSEALALAVLDQHSGKIERAIVHVREAAALAEEIGLPGELWPILGTLGDLCLMQGHKEQATAIARKLADNIVSDEQRANFLASQLVQRVLEK